MHASCHMGRVGCVTSLGHVPAKVVLVPMRPDRLPVKSRTVAPVRDISLRDRQDIYLEARCTAGMPVSGHVSRRMRDTT
jgi:hypothetical protein